jgi:hypothetical protein
MSRLHQNDRDERAAISSTTSVPQEFYRVGRVIAHAPEDDQAIPRRLDLVVKQLEAVAEAERSDLAFNQPLRRIRKRTLRLADADRERAALGLTDLDQKLAEEMRFSRASPTIYAFVSRGRKQRPKYSRCGDFQD